MEKIIKTFRQLTESYVDSYALHRTSTGPGINGYVPVADLNASKSSDNIEMLKLTTKALRTMPGSPKQKEIIKKLNVFRKRLGLEPLSV